MRVYVRNFCQRCMTRSKGKKFYEFLKNLNTNKIEIDFSNVEYVSPSFLDESVWKLAEENYHIIIHDPENIIENKLEKIKQWTKSNIKISKQDKFLELAF